MPATVYGVLFFPSPCPIKKYCASHPHKTPAAVSCSGAKRLLLPFLSPTVATGIAKAAAWFTYNKYVLVMRDVDDGH